MKSKKTPVERELKYALSASGYRKLVERFDPWGKQAKHQENVYFDDAKASLRRRGIGLRIRFIDDKEAVMTLKYAAESAAASPRGFSARQEVEASLPRAKARALTRAGSLANLKVAPVRSLAGLVPAEVLGRLRAVGSLATRRTKAKYAGLTLEIDACEVFGKVFYELEIETKNPKAADKKVRALLREIGQKTRPLDRSKLARFWKEYRLARKI